MNESTASRAESTAVDENASQEASWTHRGRVRRAAGRWSTAVAVFAVVGAGVGYGILNQERAELPGLTTQSDGRWKYPRLTLPKLPSGAPRPFAEGNVGEIHHANVQDLLLPAPVGAREHKGLPSIEGEWVSNEQFAKVFVEEDREKLEETLVDETVRHIAARGWTMPDGTRTSIYLLQFNSTAFTGAFYRSHGSAGLAFFLTPVGAKETEYDENWPLKAVVPNVPSHPMDETAPRGRVHVRHAYLVAGDTLAVIVQSRPGRTADVPFQQTVILQSQLLG